MQIADVFLFRAFSLKGRNARRRDSAVRPGAGGKTVFAPQNDRPYGLKRECFKLKKLCRAPAEPLLGRVESYAVRENADAFTRGAAGEDFHAAAGIARGRAAPGSGGRKSGVEKKEKKVLAKGRAFV